MSDPYQTVEELRDRLTESYRPGHFYNDNEEMRFTQLLETLESDSRSIIERHNENETYGFEEREDELRATDDAAIRLIFPVVEVDTVEVKHSGADDWDELDPDRWKHSEHSLILRRRSRGRPHRRNRLADYARRLSWGDLFTDLRVSYDRGFDPVPPAVLDIQTELITRMLRNRRLEQNVAALEPENVRQFSESVTTLTDEQRDRLDDLTTLGGRTFSV